MDKKPETIASAIRLTKPHFVKLRALMQHYGDRRWLEGLIDARYKRVLGDKQAEK